MATKGAKSSSAGGVSLGATGDALLLAAASAGDVPSWETGRYLVTFKEGAAEAGISELQAGGLNVADANEVDFVGVSALDDADVLSFPHLGVAVVAGDPAHAQDLTAQSEVASDSAIKVIEPELFVFSDSGLEGYLQGADAGVSEYLRGFVRAATTIREDLAGAAGPTSAEVEPQLLGATWGLTACGVPPSTKSGAEIKVAVLDTGFDVAHPDFPAARFGGRQSFVAGQEVQDLHSHGTHCIGTACGPKSPAGPTPRYGIAYRASIFVGKVLSNTGSGTQASVLAGMNWAIAQGCQVISMSLGSSAPVNAAYTAAGQAALNSGCLIIAAAGNSCPNPTGSPANSPTIMSVASLDKDLRLSSFTQLGKIEIAGAGPRRLLVGADAGPLRHKSGTSMATPHVAGCAALWAQTSPNLRAMSLWRKLQETAKPLPLPATQVGAGLVQAP